MKNLFTLILIGISVASFAQVNVSFKLKAIDTNNTAVDTTLGVYIVGDVTNWQFSPMEDLGDHYYQFDTTLSPNDTLSYYFVLVNSWDNAGDGDWNYYKKFREVFDSTSIASCTPIYKKWEGDRWILVPSKDTLITASWGVLCPETANNTGVENVSRERLNIYPNPTNGDINIETSSFDRMNIEVFDTNGKVVKNTHTTNKNIPMNLSGHRAGIYMIKVSDNNHSAVKKIILK
jgi:hypothetical protein